MLTLQKWPKGVSVFLGLRSQKKATEGGARETLWGLPPCRGRSLTRPGSLSFPCLSHSLTHYQLDLGLCPQNPS